MFKCYDALAQTVRDIRRAMLTNPLFPRREIPKPIADAILTLYNSKKRQARDWHRTIRQDRVINDGQPVKLDSLFVGNLQRYAYVMGELAALEGIMDRLFIDYT